MEEGEHQLVWLGDLYRHHPRWDSPSNDHLFTQHNLDCAEVLIRHLTEFGLEMALPEGIPTLEASRTKNTTRPDNVFCTEGLLERLRSCAVLPENRPVQTDHLPIQTILGVPMEVAPPRPSRDFRGVDWGEFAEALAARRAARIVPEVITTKEDFDAVLDALMTDIQATIEEHVPLVADTPSRSCARSRRRGQTLSRTRSTSTVWTHLRRCWARCSGLHSRSSITLTFGSSLTPLCCRNQGIHGCKGMAPHSPAKLHVEDPITVCGRRTRV